MVNREARNCLCQCNRKFSDAYDTDPWMGIWVERDGNLAEAKALYKRAQVVFESKLGPNHNYTKGVGQNLAAVAARIERGG